MVAVVAVVSVDDAAVLAVPVVLVVAVVSVALVTVVEETPVSTDAVSVLALLSFLQPKAKAAMSSTAQPAATNDLFMRTISIRLMTGGKPGRDERCPLNEAAIV